MDSHNEERTSNMITEPDDNIRIDTKGIHIMIFNNTTIYLAVNSDGQLDLPFINVSEGGFFFNSIINYVDYNFKCDKKYYIDKKGNYVVKLKKTYLQKLIGINHKCDKLVPINLPFGNLVNIYNITYRVILAVKKIQESEYKQVERKLLVWNY